MVGLGCFGGKRGLGECEKCCCTVPTDSGMGIALVAVLDVATAATLRLCSGVEVIYLAVSTSNMTLRLGGRPCVCCLRYRNAVNGQI